MLLKHQRKTPKYEAGTGAQRTAALLRNEQVEGVYMPKEKRDAKKKEI
jgi:hypothetical protein